MKYLSRDRILDFDRMSQRYGVLPSQLLNGTMDDLQFNILVTNVGVEEDNKIQKKTRRPMRGR